MIRKLSLIIMLTLFSCFGQQLETSVGVGVLPSVDIDGFYYTGIDFDVRVGYRFQKGTAVGVVGKVGWYPREFSNYLTSKVGVYVGHRFIMNNGYAIRPQLNAGLFITTLALKQPSSLRFSFYGFGVGTSCEFMKIFNPSVEMYVSVGFESGTVFDYGESFTMFSFPFEVGVRFNFGKGY